jgi:hypothetical protein
VVIPTAPAYTQRAIAAATMRFVIMALHLFWRRYPPRELNSRTVTAAFPKRGSLKADSLAQDLASPRRFGTRLLVAGVGHARSAFCDGCVHIANCRDPVSALVRGCYLKLGAG